MRFGPENVVVAMNVPASVSTLIVGGVAGGAGAAHQPGMVAFVRGFSGLAAGSFAARPLSSHHGFSFFESAEGPALSPNG
ncbi:hypothetical protein SAMN02745121_09184 [Nannocystis exedens]|uniref:Uncharacterized protein n=1 Tax=Nannocystis exedens TaxID=54 RepID=A0A1I2J4S9_9BACT|nr:hypothetical protein NAEX_02333 [Nannocystis exedens]SFF49544.1 hypothetical protein SAMN02745121_09184 [Nannocystis exedens]